MVKSFENYKKVYIHYPLFTVDGNLPYGKLGFSTLTLLTFYTRSFLVAGAILGIGTCLAASLAPTHETPATLPLLVMIKMSPVIARLSPRVQNHPLLRTTVLL